jgi:hypothetical protein
MTRVMMHITAGDSNWNPSKEELQDLEVRFKAASANTLVTNVIATRAAVNLNTIYFDEAAPVEDFSAEGIELPADESHWTHHNGNVYQVEFLTNINTKDASKYPTTVVYFNIENGARYSRPLSRWYASMTPITA